MEIVILRHGESAANAQSRMQGQLDSPLTERGRLQARRVGAWLRHTLGDWQVAYASPLLRAWETAAIVSSVALGPEPEPEPDLMEIHAGSIQGLDEAGIREKYPDYFGRALTTLGDFASFGGESYEAVQARVLRLKTKLFARHIAAAERVLLVGHGGFQFQLVKSLVCEPVPRVCILKMGNCTATLLRMRERRGTLLGEVVWHVPVELMGGESGEGVAPLFR